MERPLGWTEVERFVVLLVAGGLALVAGLWSTTLLEAGSRPWLAGLALVGLGVVALAAGIHSEVEY